MTDPYATQVRTLFWQDDHLVLIDQRLLPHKTEYVRCRTSQEVVAAIKDMVVRGAPAIGIAAAYGAVLAGLAAYQSFGNAWLQHYENALDELNAARPTAVNLSWAINIMRELGHQCHADPDPALSLLTKANELFHQDLAANQRMGDLGAEVLGTGVKVLTHCNAGALATVGYGTALGVIRSGFRDQRIAEVYATETRPWFQGARLTVWELMADNIPVTLIADHAAAQLMNNTGIDWVITGADRVAANGDVANKIGTYALALIARALGKKMMVVAPTSTIDLETKTGGQIDIEQRQPEELTHVGTQHIAASNVATSNPVFDVTPAELIDVLVTEKGVIHQPNFAQIQAII